MKTAWRPVYRHRLLGLVSLREMARRIGCSVTSVKNWQRAGLFPLPTRTIEGGKRRYYAEDEATSLTKAWAQHEAGHGQGGEEPPCA
jgi:hypothetical protein